MWIIRWIVLLFIIVVVLGFSLQNQSQMVNVTFLGWHSGDIPLYLALFISFGFGMVSFLLIAVFQQLQTLSDLSKEKRARKKLEKERDEVREEADNLKDEMEQSDKEIARLRRENEVLRDETDAARKAAPAASKDEETQEGSEGENE